MLIGRFFMIVPMLAIAGHLGREKRMPPSPGTFPVTTPLFTALLVSVILIVGALTFFPALSLGPIVEHLLMRQGRCSNGHTPSHAPSGIRRSSGPRRGIRSGSCTRAR